jgi:coenzyme PQQ precursor peptide PqqA
MTTVDPDSTVQLTQEMCMRWETPRAINLRFGMEITLYIANR